jgi:hypothetical protein
MKLNIKKIAIVGLLGTILLNSCAKKLDDAYLNPNASTKQPVEVMFPAMIGTMVGNSHASANSYGIAGDIINVSRYIQYWNNYTKTTAENGGTQFDQMGGVTASGTSMINTWSMFYWTHGPNINRIIEWGSEEQKWDFVGAAFVLRAWGWLETTNEYGDIIVSEAFNPSQLQFNYDDQSLAYDSARSAALKALTFLNRTDGNMNPTNFAASDFYLNKGDLNKWKKFAYGVLARSYAYLNNKTTYSADSVIKYATLSCTTNADNIVATFQNTAISGTKNYFGSTRGNVNSANTGLRQSKFIADLMTGANPSAFTGAFDPRTPYLLRENPNGTYKGYSPSFSALINPVLPLGDSSQSFMGTPYQTVGYLNPEQGRYIFRDAAPFPVMTASEMQFILAEALLRKGDQNGAKTAYTNAISLNIDMLASLYPVNIPAGKEITFANKTVYLSNPGIIPLGNITLTHIMLQKYIALYGWGAQETWVDMRRYHYDKDLDPATGQPVYANFKVPTGADLNSLFGNNNGKPVTRIRPSYNSEYIYNIPALTKVGAYPPGNDYHTKEMWFSQK